MVDMAIRGAQAAKTGVKLSRGGGKMSKSGSAWRLLESTPSIAKNTKTVSSSVKATAKAVTKKPSRIFRSRRPPGQIRSAVGSINMMPLGVGASLGIGAALGVGSGVRSTFRDMNQSAGNPVGFATNIGVRTAFSGNPSGSRSKGPSVDGSIAWKTRH
jgi:hypothetical protein